MIAFLLFFLLSTGARANALDGPQVNFAWFLSDQNYRPSWCVEVGNEAARKKLTEMSDLAIKAWRYAYDWMGSASIDQEPFPNIYHFQYFHEPKPCKGGEALTIYYGVENARVAEARKAYKSPLGFAHLESYDENLGRGKGFVWLSSDLDWQKSDALYAILLHELGHVFGNDHIAGTIMDGGIAQKIYEPRFLPENELYGPPGAQKWISLSQDLQQTWSLEHFYFGGEVQPSESRAQALTALLGFEVSGEALVDFRDSTTWQMHKSFEEQARKGVLRAYAGSCWHFRRPFPYRGPCERLFKAELGERIWVPVGDQMLFRKRYRGRSYGEPRMGSLQPGVLVDESGRRVEFLIESNIEERNSFYILDGGEKKYRLF